MRILSSSLAMLAVAAAALVGTARAEDAKEVTLTGTMECAKCTLKEAKACQDVLVVKDGDKTTNYYLSQDGKGKTSDHVCAGTKDGVKVTGTVAEKDGKQVLTVTKIEMPK